MLHNVDGCIQFSNKVKMTTVLGVHLAPTNYMDATKRIIEHGYHLKNRYICVANVHMLMEAYDAVSFRDLVNEADLVVPDGMPLVWVMRLKGEKGQQRVYGPLLMLRLLEAASLENIPVGFYGGKPDVLDSLVEKMQAHYPNLNVAYSFSPRFGDITTDEDAKIIEQINQSGAKILFVGLGCPKQEKWMAEHHGKIQAVMLGVGAAFDFHAGAIPQAPVWMQKLGLEWLFRLMTEPRRLWKRYLYHNPRFIILAIAELLGLLKTV